MNRLEVVDPRSFENSDQRRVNAVPPTPMYQGETKILDSLLKEAQMTPNIKTAVPQSPMKHKEEDDRKLQKMLEKYQNEVKLQMQNRTNGKKAEAPSRPSPISHSQPCLMALGTRSNETQYDSCSVSSSYQRRASASGDQILEVPHINQNNQRNVTGNQKLLQSLRDENVHLKKELDSIKRNLSKLQQIEYSYSRLEKEYEYLANERKKQENLEFNAILQLEKSVKKLTIEKEELQSRLEKSTTDPAVMTNLMINEIQQRQELFACKERQKLEIEAQNQTLEEQRNHIAMLEKALANSQERLAKREKKCEELTSMVAHVEELRKQLNEVWEERQRKEQMIETERAQWEMEKAQMRMQLNKDLSMSGSLKKSPPPGTSTDEIIRIRKTLQAKDEKIAQLDCYVIELKKAISEEQERRKSTLATLTDSFETKIKKLEEEKLERDLKISEIKQERDKYIALIDKNNGDEAMTKMENIKQQLQERRKKGRLAVTGGLIGIHDHNRSSSGSAIHSSIHRRSSSGAFDGMVPSSPTTSYTFMPINNNKISNQ